MKKLFLPIFLCLLILPIAYSVGVSPAETKINFKPNLEATITYRLRSNMNDPMYVYTWLRGDLLEYATLSTNQTFLNPGEYGQVTVHLKLPEKIEKPGYHTIQFIATESRGTGGPVGARGEVISPIDIFVQYPGKYLQITLDAKDTKTGEDAIFNVNLANLGTEKVNNARAVIDIYEGNKKLASVNTNEKPVEVFGKETLTASWSTRGQKPGNYKAVATVYYDEKTGEAEDTFRIGILSVKITDFTKEVYENQMNEFKIKVESLWNDPVENLFADVKVLKNGAEVTYFTASEKTLKAWEIKEIMGYFNPRNLAVGEYDIMIMMSFNEIGKNEKHFTLKNGTIEILKTEEKEATAAKGKILTTTNILIVVLILLVILNMIWFLRKKKNEEEIKTI